jgi:hypothetical protein
MVETVGVTVRVEWRVRMKVKKLASHAPVVEACGRVTAIEVADVNRR